MHINDYKKALQEIHVDTDKITSRFENELNKKSTSRNTFNSVFFKRSVIVCLVSFALVFVLVSTNLLSRGNASIFPITVYASVGNDELILSSTPITLSTSSQFNMQGTTGNKTSINFDLNLKCVGNNIKKITYKLSDKIITRENRGEAVAWFAENDSYIISSNSEYSNDENTYERYGYDNQWFVTKMIGNSYSVDYENQNNKNYALVISLHKDEAGYYLAEDFVITVQLSLNDGTVSERYISVHPIIGDLSTHNGSPDLPKLEMTLEN